MVSIQPVTIILLILLIGSASAGFTSTTSLYATGGYCHNTDHQWENGDNIKAFNRDDMGTYNQGAAGQGVVTGMGNASTYEGISSLGGSYNSQSEIRYSSGGTFYDTLATQHLQPNVSELACTAGELALSDSGTIVRNGATPDQQWATGYISGMGPNAQYGSTKYADDTSYALAGDMVGRGMYASYFTGEAESGTNKSSDTMQYRTYNREHDFASSGLVGGLHGSNSYIFDDFSDPFNVTSNTTATGNSSIAVNESIDTTGEA